MRHLSMIKDSWSANEIRRSLART